MDQRRTLVVTGLALILVLAIIIGTIYFLTRFIQNRQKSTTSGDVFPTASIESNVPVFGEASSIPMASGVSNNSINNSNPVNGTTSDKASYIGQGYKLEYPKTWGVLTCNNSQNFEFDPKNSSDQRGANCDVAQKPVTIMVGSNTCQGDTVNLGGIKIVKQKKTSGSFIQYKWCTQTTPKLEISHRVSPNGERATSKEDHSAQIEEMIKNLNFAGGS